MVSEQEPIDKSDLTSRLTFDLQRSLTDFADRIAQTGFPIPSLQLLMIGTHYRMNTLYAERLHELRDREGREPSEEEKGNLFEDVRAGYDKFSAFNLTETLRYQHDRALRERRIEGVLFPQEGSAEYKVIFQQMAGVGAVAQVLQDRMPDIPVSRLMPEKRDDEWKIPSTIE